MTKIPKYPSKDTLSHHTTIRLALTRIRLSRGLQAPPYDVSFEGVEPASHLITGMSMVPDITVAIGADGAQGELPNSKAEAQSELDASRIRCATDRAESGHIETPGR